MSETFGHYRIIGELGRGGMGVVYKAQEESLNRFVALKVLGAHLSEDASFVTRFRREAQAAASLQHPNIVQIFYIGEDHGQHYFSMELVDGLSLRQVLQTRGALPVAEAVDVTSQAASGLAAAHDLGLLHRDIKPPNLMITRSGLVKITDFGLALPGDEATRLTASGAFLGTPAYVPPEICEGQQPDLRSDIYALGVTLYEMLAGRVPYQSDSPMGLIREIVQATPPSVEHLNPDVPAGLADALSRMMAKDREDRFASCHEVLDALEPFHDSSRRRGSILSGTTLPKPPGDEAPTVVAPARTATTKTAPTAPQPAPTVASPPPSRVSKTSLVITAVVALLGATAVAYWMYIPPQPEPVPMAQDTVPPAAVLEPAGTSSSVATGPSGTIAPPETDGGLAEAHQADGMAGSTMDADPSVGVSSGQADSAGLSSEPTVQSTDASDPYADSTGEQIATTTSDLSAIDSPAIQNPPLQGARAPAANPQGSAPIQDSAPPPTVARVEPPVTPAPAPTLPERPRVAVIGAGEPALSVAAEEWLEGYLRGRNVEVVAEESYPAVRDELTSGNSLTGLLEVLADADIHVLVLADANFVSERELNYMGRYDVATTSRLQVSMMLSGAQKPLWPGSSREVEYTALSAKREAEEALQPMAGDLAQSLDSGWRQARNGN